MPRVSTSFSSRMMIRLCSRRRFYIQSILSFQHSDNLSSPTAHSYSHLAYTLVCLSNHSDSSSAPFVTAPASLADQHTTRHIENEPLPIHSLRFISIISPTQPSMCALCHLAGSYWSDHLGCDLMALSQLRLSVRNQRDLDM